MINCLNKCKVFSAIAVMFIGVSVVLSSCNKFDDIEKYQRPDWLIGKIYEQIASNPDYSMFATCMSDVGYDTIVNKTGTYTVFVPNNEAFQSYLNEKGLGSVESIPLKDKEDLVKFHIVQMPWNRDQLQSLSSKGWINVNDLSNNKPFAFKRQTLLKNDNKRYPVRIDRDAGLIYETIVPQAEADESRVVYSNSRKYAPVYFDGFLSAAQLSGEDYSFYFDRNYEAGNIYYAGGKVIVDDIYADNGFIYVIDRVIEPLLNAEELMDKGFGSDSYTDFKNLVYLNSDFDENNAATMAQEGAKEGAEVDQLYDLNYPELGFDIHQELTFNPNSSSATNLTTEYHNGIIVPSDAALSEFIDNVLTGPDKWANLETVPANIKKLIVNSHMADKPLYVKDISDGFFNASGDYITIDPSTIIQKSFGSNASFIGVNKVITPKAFSSVSAPLYLNPEYQTFLAAIELSGLLPALKQEDITYSLFIISDRTLALDFSMQVQWKDWKKERYDIIGYDYSEDPPKPVKRSIEDIINTMYAQISVEPLVGAARLEFLETLDGRHLIINNDENSLSGGLSSTFGYLGDSVITVNFNQIGGDYFNGNVYETNGWINFSSGGLNAKLEGSKFLSLMIKANMADKYTMKFSSSGDRHTLFLPSDEALETARADTLTGDNLKRFLKNHFIKNELIFTDGKKLSGWYNTISRVKTGSSYNTDKLNLSLGIDEISILQNNGELLCQIEEEPGISNIICTKVKEGYQGSLPSYVTEAVIHRIDTVLFADF